MSDPAKKFGQRAKPFSHKQKKKQLQEKRKNQQRLEQQSKDSSVERFRDHSKQFVHKDVTASVDRQYNATGHRSDPPRGATAKRNPLREALQGASSDCLRTVFEPELLDAVSKRIENSRIPIIRQDQVSLWASPCVEPLPIPRRPEWDARTTPQELDDAERAHFDEWLRGLYGTYGVGELNYFEHNLEVWRQLWRVCERSDVLLHVVDARCPLLHFSSALYAHVVHHLAKPMLLVFNKSDLVPWSVLCDWERYFARHYPRLQCTFLSSHSTALAAPGALMSEAGVADHMEHKRTVATKARFDTAPAAHLLRACLAVAPDWAHVPLRSAADHVLGADDERGGDERDGDGLDQEDARDARAEQEEKSTDDDDDKHTADVGHAGSDEDDHDSTGIATRPTEGDSGEESWRDTRRTAEQESVVTLGTVGQPNVGKSSLINALMRRKVVSTSRTPGHTKHLQTIVLAPSVVLCDCPGLVFPALGVSKELQVLAGVFPLAQVREPFSAIALLAQHCPVERVYRLPPPPDGAPWSAWTICEQYAILKGYRTARGGRPDVHRAGREILRDALDGRLVYIFVPPEPSGALHPDPHPAAGPDHCGRCDDALLATSPACAPSARLAPYAATASLPPQLSDSVNPFALLADD